MKPSVKKYISRNQNSYSIESEPEKLYRGSVIIPAYAESEFLPETLERLSQNNEEYLKQTLILVVVNNPPDGEIAKYQDNLKCLEYLKNSPYFYIDASSPGKEIDPKGGVGAARKIGMDKVLEYLDWSSDPLILCLDADTLVEPNYLEAVYQAFEQDCKAAGGVVSFEHQAGTSPEEQDAICDYELFMRYYVLALNWADSPYAYHSLGSAITCRADAYVRAGGMRPRNGGEDFYFMQALRKSGPVMDLDSTCVYPSSRISDRVPFGTGPRIAEIVSGKGLKFYNPEIFRLLREMFQKLSDLSVEQFEILPEILMEGAENAVVDFLRGNNFESNWRKIYLNTPRDSKKMYEAFHTWFDAFRTLRFIHDLEEFYPRQELNSVFSRDDDFLESIPRIEIGESKWAFLLKLRKLRVKNNCC